MMILDVPQIRNLVKKLFDKSIYQLDHKIIDNDINEITLTEFSEDFKNYSSSLPFNNPECYEIILLNPGLLSLLTYRLSRAAYNKRMDEKSALLYSLVGRYHTGIEIYYSAEIGFSCKINHGIGTIIGARCKIGSNFLIHQGVTIGDRNGGRPIIGNNVVAYAGAKILGNIEIGDGVIIGANAVVTKSIPPGKVVVGIPAKIIR